jgi:hypothetical protein
MSAMSWMWDAGSPIACRSLGIFSALNRSATDSWTGKNLSNVYFVKAASLATGRRNQVEDFFRLLDTHESAPNRRRHVEPPTRPNWRTQITVTGRGQSLMAPSKKAGERAEHS